MQPTWRKNLLSYYFYIRNKFYTTTNILTTNNLNYFIMRKIFTFLFALAASIGLSWADTVLADCELSWMNVPDGGVVGTIGHEDEIKLPFVNASMDFIQAYQEGTATLRLGSTDESVLAVYGFNNFEVNGVGECDVYVVHDEDAVFAYDSAAFHVTVNPAPEPTYLDADFAIDFRTNPYTVVGGGALPTGVEVSGTPNGDISHGYTGAIITIPVTAGNYLVKMGTCQYSHQDGVIKNEDGSVTYTTLATNNGTCYHQNTATNVVGAIFNVPTDQVIKVYGAQYTPYFSIQKMPEIPAFTDFTINFMSDVYIISDGTLPTGTVIEGTPNTGQTAHGFQNVIATVPMKAGKYRLTLGTCQYGTGTGNVMSETNVELASFDQKTAACFHQDPAKNIISMIFDIDQDQHITIDCGNYTPYMKLEAVTSYAVEFALGDAEGTAPTAVDVTVGEDITMPVNKTMYKEGYTLTGWSDGVNTYAIGDSFTPDNDVVLTPVFTANEADLLNASSDVTVKWYFGGDNGAPSMLLQGATGLLVAQATIGDKTVDVKLAIDATDGKFAPQADTEWANVNLGTIFTYPYKEGMTVNVNNYKSYVTYVIADAEGKVSCYENDNYSFIEVTYPATQPTGVEDVQSDKVQATKILRDGMLLIVRDGKLFNVTGAQVK